MYYLTANTPGALVESKSQNIADNIERFIQFVNGTERTVDTYRKGIKYFMEYLASKGITQPTRDDIVAYREYLLTATHNYKGQQVRYKPTTIRGYLASIKVFFAYLEQEGLYKNITTRIKSVKIDEGHKKDPMTGEQVANMLAHIDRTNSEGKRDYALVTLLATTGLRVVEPQRALVEDLQELNGQPILRIQGKGRTDKTDYVKIVPQAQTAIRDYLATRGEVKATDPLFISDSNNSKGKGLTTRTISGIIKSAMRRAGYDSSRLTAHSLRHTVATLALKNGAKLVEVQQLLRHKNINTTLIYQHAIEREKTQTEAIVASAIFNL